MNDAEAFYSLFNARKTHILQLLESSSNKPIAADEINSLNDQCKQQRKAISDHDIEYYLKELDKLYTLANSSNNISDVSKGDTPKKKTFKFSKGFGSKRPSSLTKPTVASFQNTIDKPLLDDTELALFNKSKYNYTSNNFDTKDKTYRKLVLTNIDSSDLAFTNYSFGTATLTSITNSLVYIDAVPTGPIYLDRIVDSTIIIKSCQQCRIHDSVNSVIVLACRSGRPIIENCSKIRFGRISKIFPSMSTASDNSVDWVDVDDFNWLVKDQHSENWTELDDTEDKRIESKVRVFIN